MKRSHIPQEKISNKLNVMNHTANDDDAKSELIKSLSVQTTFDNCDRESVYAANELGLVDYEIGEHIYENLPRVCKNKYQSLTKFVSSLKSRTKDLRLRKHAKKLQSRMFESHATGDEILLPLIASTNYSENLHDYEHFVCSYTSCQEENIYENLNFNFLRDWNENETVLENDALRSWLLDLSFDVEDYECSDIMITKCIPSKHESILCTFEEHSMKKLTPQSEVDSELEQYKLDILNKCFTSIWRKESENEVLNGLYGFLNDVFSTYFKRNATHVDDREVAKVNSVKSTREEKRRKTRETVHDTALCKNIDKKTVQKLETFILSATLNRLTITYDKCMKFYFSLESSQTLSFFGAETSKLLNYCRFVACNNGQRFGISNKKDLRQFMRTLRLILNASENSKRLEAPDNKSLDDVVEVEQVVEKEENIYQSIWKWQTDCKSAIRCENIYAPLSDFIVELDEQDWEIDSEFSFVDSKANKLAVLSSRNMFNTVVILYSNENPELNQIIYSSASPNISKERIEQPLVVQSDEASLTKDVIQCSEISTNSAEFDSVTAWKHFIRQPNYLEDEEDFIMSENQISSLKIVQPEDDKSTIMNNHDNSDGGARNKLVDLVSIGSYELKPATSDVSLVSSANSGSTYGLYRQTNENDNVSISSAKVELIEEPKKEREKFRDKIKVKFKLKSSKAPVQETVEVPKEVEEDFFGSNLETVEKDSEFKQVPKIVVECIHSLETNSNLKTPGLYRVSGNKTVIEAFKKKSNDKKNAKKESRYASLRNQDVHCVTGILKMFFRELTPPLMPSRIFVLCTSDKVTLDQISSFLLEMPPSNYQTLRFLMAHLKRVELQQEENLMNSGNLAICWGLCIFSSSFDTTNQFFENDISKCNMLCKRMIDYFHIIFKE